MSQIFNETTRKKKISFAELQNNLLQIQSPHTIPQKSYRWKWYLFLYKFKSTNIMEHAPLESSPSFKAVFEQVLESSTTKVQEVVKYIDLDNSAYI